MVPNTRQITHSAAPDQNHRVLLQVVPFARDIGRNFDVVGEAHSGHLSKRRVRLLRSNRANLQANASFLRRALLKLPGPARERVSDCSQCRCLRLFAGPLSRVSYQLIKRRQRNLQLSGLHRDVFSARAPTRTAVAVQLLNVKSYKYREVSSTIATPCSAPNYECQSHL